jgi:type I restriction enzyme S subunit
VHEPDQADDRGDFGVNWSTYPEYRPADIQWLDDIPSHWSERRGKYLFKRMQRAARPEDEIVTAFRDGEVTLRRHRREDGFTVALKESGYQGVRRGDLVIHAMDAFAGAIGVSVADGKCSPVYSCCRPNSGVSARLYAYLLRAMAGMGFIESLAKGIRERSTDFRWADFADLRVPVPPSAEQEAITQFLDHETIRIDALIKEQQRLIDLLQEKRQAVISHAVAKGLDPDVPTRDSGIEWLGDVPHHWKVFRLNHLVDARGGGTPSKEREDYWDGDIPWISPKDLKVREISTSADQITENAQRESGLSWIPVGSVVIVVRGMILAHSVPVAITTSPVTVNQDIKALTPKGPVTEEYLLLLLEGIREAVFEFIDASAHGTRKLEWDRFEHILLPVPPKDEQREIQDFVRRERALLDKLTHEAQRSSRLLHERRSALITAAVTGKIDVRGWKPQNAPLESELPHAAETEAPYG